MFLMLGLLVFPSQLWTVAREGFAIALFLSIVARPVAVWLCLAPFRFPPREIAYIGWVGLRGAVPIILATFPVLSGVPGAMKVFNIVFFIVVMSALLPGVTIRWVTRRLGLEAPEKPVPPAVLEVNSTRCIKGELVSFFITEPLAVCHAALSEIAFPPNTGAVLILRGEELVAARGSTVLRPGDHVYVLCRPQDKLLIELLFGRPQQA
jgi:cell volume regulation protein A